MAKVALITDIHWGVRNDSPVFAAYQEKFYSTVFFPTLKERGIKNVINAGDTFDRRKYSAHVTVKRADDAFFKPLAENGITMHMIVGNHDCPYRSTNDANSPELFLRHYSNIKVYSTGITRVNFDYECCGHDFIMVPWLHNQQQKEMLNEITATDPGVIIGHFDIAGFYMHQGGTPSEHGIDRSWFAKHPLVISGHYHTQSKQGNIHYIGNPFEFTWADYNDPRGFWIIDTQSLEMEFIKNPYTMFHKFVYNDGCQAPVGEYLKDTFVKIVVQKKSDPYMFEMWLETIHATGPADCRVMEMEVNSSVELTEDQLKEQAKSTSQIIDMYIDTLEDIADKAPLKQLMAELYNECNLVE